MDSPRVTVWVQRFAGRKWLQLQWRDPRTGRRKTKSAGTADEKEARRKAADLAYELSRGLYSEPSRLTWEAFVDLFTEEYLPHLRARTRTCYRSSLAAFARHGAPPRLLSAVDVRCVSRYHAALAAAGHAPGSVRLYLTQLRTALLWARRQRLIAEVPEFPRVAVPRERPRPLSGEAFDRLLDTASGDPHAVAFLRLGNDAGLRIGEALALSWEPGGGLPWVDLEDSRIRFPADASKNKREEWVPVHPELRAALEALPERRGAVLRRGGRRVGHRTGCSWFVRLRDRAGIRGTYHQLRKAFATRYAARVPLQVLMALLRHTTPSTAARYYDLGAAVEEAVLGAQRNEARNTPAPAPQET